MKRALIPILLAAAVGMLLWFFPLFHIVPAGQAQAEKQRAAFSAAEVAATFWNGRLKSALETAPLANDVLDALAKDPRQARELFGRTVGFSRSCYFFLRGAGSVVSVGPKSVTVSWSGRPDRPDVELRTGLLFGNTVRDATGLLNPSDFPNSQHFNDLSTELNRLVETRVLPDLKEHAIPGKRVHFVGCAEVGEDDQDLRPLKVVPLSVRIE